MFEKYKYKRIIKEAVEKTVEQFSDCCPRISKHFFCGKIGAGPEKLVVCYLFKTDKELATARDNGLCKNLEETTIRHLIESGYPKEAFERKTTGVPAGITFTAYTEEQKEHIIDKLLHRKASIDFASEEDVENETGGNYDLYFQ